MNLRLVSLTLTAMVMASTAVAADAVLSPRAREARSTSKTIIGITDGKAPLGYRGGKAAYAGASKVETGVKPEDRDLVRESRAQVYTGKGVTTRRTFEIAPAK